MSRYYDTPAESKIKQRNRTKIAWGMFAAGMSLGAVTLTLAIVSIWGSDPATNQRLANTASALGVAAALTAIASIFIGIIASDS